MLEPVSFSSSSVLPGSTAVCHASPAQVVHLVVPGDGGDVQEMVLVVLGFMFKFKILFSEVCLFVHQVSQVDLVLPFYQE